MRLKQSDSTDMFKTKFLNRYVFKSSRFVNTFCPPVKYIKVTLRLLSSVFVLLFSNKIFNVYIVELSNFCLFSTFFLFSEVGFSQQDFVVAKKDPNKSKLGSSPGSSSSAIIAPSSPGISLCSKPVKLGHYIYYILNNNNNNNNNKNNSFFIYREFLTL